jgi:hypothetical protein
MDSSSLRLDLEYIDVRAGGIPLNLKSDARFYLPSKQTNWGARAAKRRCSPPSSF